MFRDFFNYNKDPILTVKSFQSFTFELDNAIRISPKLLNNNLEHKNYIIQLTPNMTFPQPDQLKKPIFYPIIFDEKIPENEMLISSSIRMYIDYIPHDKYAVKILPIDKSIQKDIDYINIELIKITPFYKKDFKINKERLLEKLQAHFQEFPFYPEQLLLLEYEINATKHKFHFKINSINSINSNKSNNDKNAKNNSSYVYCLNKKSLINITLHSNLELENVSFGIEEKKQSPMIEMLIKEHSKSKKSSNDIPEIKELEIDFPELSLEPKKVLPPEPPKPLSLDFTRVGIGGLNDQLQKFLNNVYYSRGLGALAEAYGTNHVKGILLYGPPGTGKTLIAKKIASILQIKKENVETVGGPEIKNKFVGESQARLRQKFDKAKSEWLRRGKESDLHLIMFDELDCLFPVRGARIGGAGVEDDLTGQMLTILDGLESIGNIIVIGTTNRKDLIDKALFRENRFALQLEISLPDEKGRREILDIKVDHMRQLGVLADNVDLDYFARITRNYSGADIEQLVRIASNYAEGGNYICDKENNTLQVKPDLKEVHQLEKVTQAYLEQAFREITPTNGIDKTIFNFDKNKFSTFYPPLQQTIEAFKTCLATWHMQRAPNQLSVLLTGPTGSGKTNLAKYLAEISNCDCIKLINPESLLGISLAHQLNLLDETFISAKRTETSVIILDNIENILGVDAECLRYDNQLRLKLISLLDAVNNKNKCVIIGTSQSAQFMSYLKIADLFDEKCTVKLISLSLKSLNNIDEMKLLLNDIIQSLSLNLTIDHDQFITPLEKECNLPMKELIYLLKKSASPSNGQVDLNLFIQYAFKEESKEYFQKHKLFNNKKF